MLPNNQNSFKVVEQYGLQNEYMRFSVQNTEYVIHFARHDEGQNLAIQDIYPFSDDKIVYTIKFGAAYFYDNELIQHYYDKPNNASYQFSRTFLDELHDKLEKILIAHFKLYQPDFYFFKAERRSLIKWYARMCDERDDELQDFKILRNGDCFIIETFKEQK